MTKDFLKTFYADSWLAECIDHLEAEFFDPKKEVRFLGEKRYHDLRPMIASNPATLVERIMTERAYRQKRMLLIPSNESEKIYIEVSLEISREIEDRLIRKMTARQTAVGDIDKAKAYPLDELVEFKHGFTRCIFHQEKTASMKYYKEENRAHCFSCNKSFDSIDIYRQLNNCSFKEAVKNLTL